MTSLVIFMNTFPHEVEWKMKIRFHVENLKNIFMNNTVRFI